MNVDVLAAIPPEMHRRLSVDEYHRMIDAGVVDERDRVELIEGVIVAVSPHSPEHAWVVRTLVELFMDGLPRRDWAVLSQVPLTLARSEPEPDVAIVERDLVVRAERHPTTASLVVEVARTSLAVDRAMAGVYAEAGVDEYWIVDVDRRRVEVHREPAADGYRAMVIAGDGDVLQPVALPACAIQVGSLFKPRA